jgi:hypothetical protein
MIEFDFDYEDAVNALDDFSDEIEDEIEGALDKTFTKIADEARIVHRFKTRTGRLKSAVQTEVQGYSARAFINDGLAPHGKYIHDGFKSWAPDPFLEDALRRNELSIGNDIESAVSRAITKSGL